MYERTDAGFYEWFDNYMGQKVTRWSNSVHSHSQSRQCIRSCSSNLFIFELCKFIQNFIKL